MRTNMQFARRHDLPACPAFDTAFAHDVLAGLSSDHKSIPGRWLHDARGSALFERITDAPEYYPARSEMLILRNCAAEVAALAGPGAGLVELGRGACRGAALLLAALQAPACHVPVDLAADFAPLDRLPAEVRAAGRAVFFAGSTIGSLAPDPALDLLRRLARLAGPDSLLVLGADATQDPSLLLPAYADAQGRTAAFNQNLLLRMNRELGADFDVDSFRHAARYDTRQRRMELHLVSRREQWVQVAGRRFHFDAGESIHTDSAYKYGLLRIQSMASSTGWSQRQLWTDAHARFGVHVFERTAS